MTKAESARWDRQPNETAPAFEAFARYRDMGPGRSTRLVARELGKSASLIGRWSSRHSWSSRVVKWDRRQDEVRQEAQLEEVERAARRHSEVLSTHLETLARVAVEAAERIDSSPEALKSIGTAALLELVAKTARPLTLLIDAHREVLGLHADAGDSTSSESQSTGMTRAEAERYLLGVGFDDGAEDRRRAALNDVSAAA